MGDPTGDVADHQRPPARGWADRLAVRGIRCVAGLGLVRLAPAAQPRQRLGVDPVRCRHPRDGKEIVVVAVVVQRGVCGVGLTVVGRRGRLGEAPVEVGAEALVALEGRVHAGELGGALAEGAVLRAEVLLGRARRRLPDEALRARQQRLDVELLLPREADGRAGAPDMADGRRHAARTHLRQRGVLAVPELQEPSSVRDGHGGTAHGVCPLSHRSD
mmetsp:Transcript_66567/g.174515  ORF Transcript_66567/g.174515 Transcript_66567/m.174515 type:complete len:217 (+) Transcript_66567:449-1099(+)